MQNSQLNSNTGAGRADGLTNDPGNGQIQKSYFQYPPITFYSFPDEYKGLEISDKKPTITNWNVLKEKEFSFFYQHKNALIIWQNKVLNETPIPKIGDNWPILNLIPRNHVRIEKVAYYDVVYKLKCNGQIYEAAAWVYSSKLNPELIGKKLKRGFDDVAFYIGPVL